MKNSLIIIGFLLPVLALASLTEKTEHLDRGKKGVAEKLVIFRDGAPIYERYRQDRNRDGIFEHYIESFIMDGQNVLQFTFIGGSRGTVVRGNTEAQVILSSEKDSWRPDGVLIDIKGKNEESNQSPLPTPTAVTPPAGQEARQP